MKFNSKILVHFFWITNLEEQQRKVQEEKQKEQEGKTSEGQHEQEDKKNQG